MTDTSGLAGELFCRFGKSTPGVGPMTGTAPALCKAFAAVIPEPLGVTADGLLELLYEGCPHGILEPAQALLFDVGRGLVIARFAATIAELPSQGPRSMRIARARQLRLSWGETEVSIDPPARDDRIPGKIGRALPRDLGMDAALVSHRYDRVRNSHPGAVMHKILATEAIGEMQQMPGAHERVVRPIDESQITSPRRVRIVVDRRERLATGSQVQAG